MSHRNAPWLNMVDDVFFKIDRFQVDSVTHPNQSTNDPMAVQETFRLYLTFSSTKRVLKNSNAPLNSTPRPARPLLYAIEKGMLCSDIESLSWERG